VANRQQGIGQASMRVAANLRRMFNANRLLTYSGIARHLTEHGLPTSALTVRRLADGQRAITIDELEHLAGALDVDPLRLLSGTAEIHTSVTWNDVPKTTTWGDIPADLTWADLGKEAGATDGND
jgi:transcriptional regulator with XRE-family HTH domain